MLVVWNSDDTLGYDIVDNGHRLVIETVNRLNAATAPAQCRGVVDQMLAVLGDHLTRQFQQEDARLTQSRWSGRDSHTTEHREMLTVLNQLSQAHAQGDEVADILLLNLVSFLGHHLRGTDRADFTQAA